MKLYNIERFGFLILVSRVGTLRFLNNLTPQLTKNTYQISVASENNSEFRGPPRRTSSNNLLSHLCNGQVTIFLYFGIVLACDVKISFHNFLTERQTACL